MYSQYLNLRKKCSRKDNKKVYIVFSSIVFGLLHAASGINPEFPLVLVLLQIVNALLLGIIFALLYLKTHSIYTTILLHTLFNLFASISNEDSLERTFLAVGVLLIVYIVFGFYLIKSNMKFLQIIKQG
ncbi:lysostaphin resistance A-like protein [Enterococcus sp. LJL90]